MSELGRISESIYCAFCKIPRAVYTKKHIGWTNVVLSFLTAKVVMWITWQEFNAKLFILFAIFLAITEVFIQVRWRMSVNCPYCGFDPVLYVTNREAVVKKVKAQLERASRNPGLLLSKFNPLRNLPVAQRKERRPIPAKELHSEEPLG